MKPGKHQSVRHRSAMIRILLLVFLCSACSVADNSPSDPGTPAPAAHDGTFVSEHGTMQFNGDGERVVIEFDAGLAELTGLPEGRQEGSYVFLSGDLPPHGSYPVRYDTAHELRITVGEQSAVINMGIAAEDGSHGYVGVNMVTPERIPMLFRNEGGFFCITFEPVSGTGKTD